MGAVELPWDTVREAVLAEYADRYELVEDTLDDDTLALARTLAPEHGRRRTTAFNGSPDCGRGFRSIWRKPLPHSAGARR